MSRALRLLALASAACLACVPRGPHAPNFVLVVADTLRADHLHFAGHPRELSPAFDRLQRESTWFRRAYSTSAWTLPSTASLLLSQLPSQHGVVHWSSRLAPEQTGLAARLGAAGYRTGLFTANRIIAGGRGFESSFEYDEFLEHPEHAGGPPLTEAAFANGQALVERALAWLERTGGAHAPRPFFVYLHFMEPHAPYLCPDGAGEACEEQAKRLNAKLLELGWDLGAEERETLEQLYDADVVRMDGVLDALLRGLAAGGLLDDTWLIVVADHGELLGEWDMYMHGRTLYEELVHVPLLMRPPGGGGRVVDQAVSLIDVAPTVLDLAGLEPPAAFRGRSLRPLLDGRSLPSRAAVAELLPSRAGTDPRQRHLVAVTDGRRKFLLRTDGVLQRFDLLEDPGEQHPLPASQEEFERLLAEGGLRFDPSAYQDREIDPPSPEMLETLRRLGYVP